MVVGTSDAEVVCEGRRGGGVSPSPGVVVGGGWGEVADCVQWLCYLVQLILAQWCQCLPVIIDHCIPTPDTHNTGIISYITDQQC